MKSMKIEINIPDETIAIWLSDLFKNEIEEAKTAADNEHLFALGSDGENAAQHEENSELNKQYVEILKRMYNEVQQYWGQYGNYIE